MIAQTKHAIDALTAAGLNRAWFSVRTPRNKHGEYGHPDITILGPWREIAERADDLAAHGISTEIHRFHESETGGVMLSAEAEYEFDKPGQIRKFARVREYLHNDGGFHIVRNDRIEAA